MLDNDKYDGAALEEIADRLDAMQNQIDKLFGESEQLKSPEVVSETENTTWKHEELENVPEQGQAYWFLDDRGDIRLGMRIGVPQDNDRLEICNVFKTKEEAQLAIQKLQALKRLRDKGFKFEGIKQDYTRWPQSPSSISRNGKRYLQFSHSEDDDWMRENRDDLDLLFEEEE